MSGKFADVSIFLQFSLQIPVITVNAIKGEPVEIFSFCFEIIVGKGIFFHKSSGFLLFSADNSDF